MYVTRPLSLYKRNPEALSSPPPEGPNSGYLVLHDEESTKTCCFGLCKNTSVRDLPFPQNKLLVFANGSDESSTQDYAYLIPAINQPLSSNTYYIIKPKGNHKGEAYASSREEDKVTCCFCRCVKDVKPRPLDPEDTFQQFTFSTSQSCGTVVLQASSVAHDAHPPLFLRSPGWSLYSQTPKGLSLDDAPGLDSSLRARLPDFNFPPSLHESKPVTVGKWYCPFMFVKDTLTPKEQVKKSLYYEMSLEQVWERIFFYENALGQGNRGVLVDVMVETESFKVEGADGERDRQAKDVDAVVWYKSLDGRRDQSRVGLSSLVVRRMMWEEERVGWVPKEERREKVMKVDEFGRVGTWTRYGCYMLVERFVLKRMDGREVLRHSFSHTNQIRSKWE